MGRRPDIADPALALPSLQLVEQAPVAKERVGIVAGVEILGKEHVDYLRAQDGQDLLPR